MERPDDHSDNPIVRSWRHSPGTIINEHADGKKTASATPEAFRDLADLHGVPVEIFAGFRATAAELAEIAERWAWERQASQMPELPPDTVAKLEADTQEHLADLRVSSWWDGASAYSYAESRLSNCYCRMTELGGTLPAGTCPVKLGPGDENQAVEVFERILEWCQKQSGTVTETKNDPPAPPVSEDEPKFFKSDLRKTLALADTTLAKYAKEAGIDVSSHTGSTKYTKNEVKRICEAIVAGCKKKDARTRAEQWLNSHF